ncbi:zinc finger BED domain-containing protein 5-like [Palaemon carinicauda]|uniref:zinc finger BED domain-containing protein 5-like n=1 Tax=Palaemon carinicauda TaxID=392227 RepID=UPI0035B599A6
MLPVSSATAESLFELLKIKLREYDMNFENCIGFSSDGAASMVGSKNSVWTRIKDVAPNSTQMKCVCHSLALCIRHAFEKLPSSLGFLISETPLWFSNSNLRREEYKSLFETLNPPSETECRYQAPLPFQKDSKVRWLVKGKVMLNILLNWEELKAYFAASENTGHTITKYKARLLKEMLCDKINYLYFVFATPIIRDLEAVNAKFQATKTDPYKLSNELEMLRKTLCNRIYNYDGTEKLTEEIDFGAKFKQEIL